MKKFFLVLFILVSLGAAGFAGWYFLLKEDPLKVEFYGDKEILEHISGDGEYANNDIVTLTAEERLGYEFESWLKDDVAISSSRIYTFVMSEKTAGKYTAVYRAKEYNISTLNNGVYNISNSAATDEMVEININFPVGYELEEAYYVIEGTEEKIVIKDNKFKMPPHHISLFINLKEIKYTISYDLCGGEFDDNEIKNYTINTPTFDLPVPTKLGHTFLGWTDDNLLTPTLNYTITQGSTTDVEVTANWKAIVYNITTNVVGDGSIHTTSTAEYNFEQYYDLFVSDGWMFVEIYYIKAGDTEKIYMGADLFIMPASDITIYVILKKVPYSVAMDEFLMYGYVEPSHNPAYVGDVVTITAYPDFGYEVLGYRYSTDGGAYWIETDGNTFIMPSTGVVISAIFSAIEYPINYVLDGGTLPQGTQTTYWAWEYIQLPIPTKLGYSFIGWYDNAEFNGEAIISFDGYNGSDRTFYALFSYNEYCVYFCNYDGTVLNSIVGPWHYGETPYYWEAELPTKPSTPEYDYVFAGWNPEIVPITTDATYTAVYTAVPRVYNTAAGGTITCVDSSVHSENVVVTLTPNTGFTLKKAYYIKAGDSAKVEFTNSFVMPKSNVTIYAEFVKIPQPYNITISNSVASGIISCPESAQAGENVTIQINDSVTLLYYSQQGSPTNTTIYDVVVNGETNTVTFVMPEQDIVLEGSAH